MTQVIPKSRPEVRSLVAYNCREANRICQVVATAWGTCCKMFNLHLAFVPSPSNASHHSKAKDYHYADLRKMLEAVCHHSQQVLLVRTADVWVQGCQEPAGSVYGCRGEHVQGRLWHREKHLYISFFLQKLSWTHYLSTCTLHVYVEDISIRLVQHVSRACRCVQAHSPNAAIHR